MLRKPFFVCLFLVLLAGLFTPVVAQQINNQQDKTELIHKALRYALLENQDLPTYRMVKNRKKI